MANWTEQDEARFRQAAAELDSFRTGMKPMTGIQVDSLESKIREMKGKRPKPTPKYHRDGLCYVGLTKSEKAWVTAKAKQEGASVSEIIKRALRKDLLKDVA